MIKWDLCQYTNELISFSTYLPLARLHLKRQFNFEDDVVYVTTWIDNGSNRFVDFFNTDNQDQNDKTQTKKREKLNQYTVNEMKEQISQEKNIGNTLNNTNQLNFNASSFMNLPQSKQERKKTKSKRDETDLQRTYEITRSYMEDEYRTQLIENKIKSDKIKDFLLSPRKFLREYKLKSSIADTAQYDPNQNDQVINQMYNKQHGTWIEQKDEDLELKFEQDDRTRYDVEWCEHITISDPFLNDAQFILPQYVMNNNTYNCPLEMPKSRFNGELKWN